MDIIDSADADEEDERQIRARRMFMYSAKALAAGAEVAAKYILFPDLRKALESFDRVYQLAREFKIVPQGVLLSGPPGSSKTSVSDYFARSLPPSNDIVEGLGAISIRLRVNPSAGLMVSLLLQAVRHPFTQVRGERLSLMQDIAFEALSHKGTRLVFVDQAHALARQRSRNRVNETKETTATDVLRDLMEKTGVGLVLLADAGMPSLEEIDAALADRVSVRLQLEHFGNDGTWSAFLGEYAKNVKLVNLTLLGVDEVRAQTHAATRGSRRALKRLLTEAVLVAVDAGVSAVAIEHLRLAFERARGPGSVLPNPYGSA